MNSRALGLSIAVCTRNRGTLALPTIQALLALPTLPVELLIIDQSDDSSLYDAVGTLPPFVRLIRQRANGLSRARNLALEECRTSHLFFTDDDCLVPPDLVPRVQETLTRWPNAWICFGNVLAETFDAATEFVPHTTIDRVSVISSIVGQRLLGGMGACMVISVDQALRIGGFDVMLGAGGPFGAAEETDLALRALRRGGVIVQCADFEVTHVGLRQLPDAAELAARYLYGSAAAYSKLIRQAPFNAIVLLIAIAVRWALRPSIVQYRSNGFSRRQQLHAFLQGFFRGLGTPLDRSTSRFGI